MQAHEQNGQEKVRAARHPQPTTVSGKSKRILTDVELFPRFECFRLNYLFIAMQISILIDFRC